MAAGAKMHRAAKIPKAPTPDFTACTLFWMAAMASPNALPTMGIAEETASLAALLVAASTWAFSAVWMERKPENTVTASTRAHLAKPYRLLARRSRPAPDTADTRARARNRDRRGSTSPDTSRGMAFPAARVNRL